MNTKRLEKKENNEAAPKPAGCIDGLEDRLADLYIGEIDVADIGEEHLEHCAYCRQKVHRFQAFLELLRREDTRNPWEE